MPRVVYLNLRMWLQSAAEARSYFEDAPGVSVVEVPINDGWARDWGPSVGSLTLSLMHLSS